MQEKMEQHRIQEFARGEFLAKGFPGANPRTITGLAGCSLSDLSNYFESKDHFPDKVKNEISDFFVYHISPSNLDSVIEFLSNDISHEDMIRYFDELTLYYYHGILGLLEGHFILNNKELCSFLSRPRPTTKTNAAFWR